MSIPKIYGKVEYQHYDIVESRINNFPDTEILGKDASGNYDLHLIHLGDKSKPKILVTASIHGSEWEGTQYSLDFFERIRDDKYPDKNFRNTLLDSFHILYIPVVNPYGYDIPMDDERIRKDGRENFNGVDLNRDFYDNTQAETSIVRGVIDEYKPFAFLDIHLRTALGSNLELYNSVEETSYVRNEFARMWEEYTGETLVINAVSGSTTGGTHRGLAINYVRDSENPYTPHTLSFLTEIGHYDNNVNGNSREDIYFYGISSIYAFFFVSTKYFVEHNDYILTGGEVGHTYKIEQEHKTIHLYRDIRGNLIRTKEEYATGDTIETKIIRDHKGNLLSYHRELLNV